MNIKEINNIFFVGIGGIGMSAIARYFNYFGKNVVGYDKTETVLTKTLSEEGVSIHYTDNITNIPTDFTPESCLVVYTPAIPFDHTELNYFRDNNYRLFKRSEILGILSKDEYTIGVAGTHGKTSVTTMTSHILKQSVVDCSAFLGGISKNYGTNFLLSENSEKHNIVVEADEFDRSFLQLSPKLALITATDADHLDIYGDERTIKKAFSEYAHRLVDGGIIIVKKGVDIDVPKNATRYSYALQDKADFYGKNIRIVNGVYVFDFVTPKSLVEGLVLGIPGLVNVENAIASLSLSWILGVTDDEMRKSLESYQGVERRFDVQIKNKNIVYIDDYAHHPEELKATINSVKELYKGKKISGIFQPHLFSRTRDFADGFAENLSLLDELILLDIYPAREEPIEGVTSDIIFKNVTTKKHSCTKDELLEYLKDRDFEVLITLGAGDIGAMVKDIKNLFN